MTDNYSFQQVKTDDKSLNDVLVLLAQTFPKTTKFSLDYLCWQYKLNPVGEVVGFNAYDGNILAAHYATMPILMNVNNVKRKGLLSLNTATHPNHRGKRLFSILAEKTYEYAAKQGYEFVIGVANANSTHGFLKNLKFELIGSLTVRVGLGANIREKQNANNVIWDKETLQWRLSNPAGQYTYSNGVIYNNMMPGVKSIMGVTSIKDISAINNIKKKDIFHPFNLYVGLGTDLSNGLYCKLPSFIKRPPFNLIFRDLTDSGIRIDKDKILFQLIDFDVQ